MPLTLAVPAAYAATMTDAPQVTPLPHDSFSRVLCVAAHPDDLEYGVSAAVAAWTAAGADVAYLLLTRGEAGIDTMEPGRTAEVRVAEEVDAARQVGVEVVEFLDHPDGMLEYGLGLRRDIARAIRRHRPDAVVVGSWDVEFVAGLNHADHRVAGMATLDAVRDAGNRWVFREQLDDGLEPHSPRWLLSAGDARPTHGVDVSGEPVLAGARSLDAHAQYLEALPWHPPGAELVPWVTGAAGPALGCDNAVVFRAWDFEAPPSFD